MCNHVFMNMIEKIQFSGQEFYDIYPAEDHESETGAHASCHMCHGGTYPGGGK